MAMDGKKVFLGPEDPRIFVDPFSHAPMSLVRTRVPPSYQKTLIATTAVTAVTAWLERRHTGHQVSTVKLPKELPLTAKHSHFPINFAKNLIAYSLAFGVFPSVETHLKTKYLSSWPPETAKVFASTLIGIMQAILTSPISVIWTRYCAHIFDPAKNPRIIPNNTRDLFKAAHLAAGRNVLQWSIYFCLHSQMLKQSENPMISGALPAILAALISYPPDSIIKKMRLEQANLDAIREAAKQRPTTLIKGATPYIARVAVALFTMNQINRSFNPPELE